jgi:GTP cyclohydrolase III
MNRKNVPASECLRVETTAQSAKRNNDNAIIEQCYKLFDQLTKFKLALSQDDVLDVQIPTLPAWVQATNPQAAALLESLLVHTLRVDDYLLITRTIFMGDNPYLLRQMLTIYAVYMSYSFGETTTTSVEKWDLFKIPKFQKVFYEEIISVWA